MKRYLLFAIIALCSLSICSALEQKGSDPVFTIAPIPDAVFARMQGKSYKDGAKIARTELRYLRLSHYDAKGNTHVGELVCHKRIAQDLKEIFEALYEAKYPIERMRLVDDYDADDERSMLANNTSCFNYRVVDGTTRLSNHSKGLAIDINPYYNPYVRTIKGKTVVNPKGADKYADRTKEFVYKIDRNDLVYKLFIQHGFTWGGAWRSSKDYQHFEKK